MQKKFILLAALSLVLASCVENPSTSDSSSHSFDELDAVTNIVYQDGVLSFDPVTNAEGYKISFIHLEEVEYEDTITVTEIDVESLGLAGNITFTVYAYAGEIHSESTSYDFTVLSTFDDVLFEAENYLANFGTGKEQSNFRNNPLAHGGAYVGGIDDAGQGVYINYLCPIAGTYVFEAYYTTAMPPAYNDVWVNGVYQSRFVFEENTGWGGDTYDAEMTSVTITLNAGWNTISIMKNGDESDNWGSYVELDYFVLKGTGATYNADDLIQYGERPTYRLEAEMGSPRKKDTSNNTYTCKNPAIKEDATNKYSNGFLLGGIENNYDGVEWHFNSPVKAKYSIKAAYAAGEFSGSKLPQISFLVTQSEVGLAKNADFNDYEKVTLKDLPYTGWNQVHVTDDSVEITLEQGKNFIYCLLLDEVNSGFFQLDYVDMTFVSAYSE